MRVKTAKTKNGSVNPVLVKGYNDISEKPWIEVTYNGKSALIEYSQFAINRSGVWSNLVARGVIIVNRAARASLTEQVDQIEDPSSFPKKMIFGRPGWCGKQFANASGQVFAPSGVTKGAIAFTPNTRKCSRKGRYPAWKKQVAGHIAGHPIPSFCVMSCFAAPLLELVQRTDNFGFELAGAGGKGKSTTQRLMASVVGPAMAKDQGYISSFYTTEAGLERLMRWHSDMPFIIDEANLFANGESRRADQKKMRAFSFQMSSGNSKVRFDDEVQIGYRFIFVTSANEPFNALLREDHRDVAHAATDRMMTISVPEGDAGVFGRLPEGYDNYGQFTRDLEQALARQYGTAMPKFLQALVDELHRDGKALKARIRQRIEFFKSKIGANENNGSDSRVADAFGLVYAAGLMAKEWGILPARFNCLSAAKHCYANYRRTVPLRQSLSERLLAIANRPETLAIDQRNLPTLTDEELKAAGAFIRTMKGETLLLMMPGFGRTMFPDWNILKDTAEFRDLNRAGKDERGRGYRCRIRANGKPDWFYAFKLPERKG